MSGTLIDMFRSLVCAMGEDEVREILLGEGYDDKEIDNLIEFSEE